MAHSVLAAAALPKRASGDGYPRLKPKIRRIGAVRHPPCTISKVADRISRMCAEKSLAQRPAASRRLEGRFFVFTSRLAVHCVIAPRFRRRSDRSGVGYQGLLHSQAFSAAGRTNSQHWNPFRKPGWFESTRSAASDPTSCNSAGWSNTLEAALQLVTRRISGRSCLKRTGSRLGQEGESCTPNEFQIFKNTKQNKSARVCTQRVPKCFQRSHGVAL